jgi:PKD repeat protein
MKTKFLKLFVFVFFTAFLTLAIANTFNVTVPAPSLTGLCVGGSYSNLGDIVITEGANTDFNANGGVLKLTISGNFEFEPSTGTVNVAGGSDLSAPDITVSNKTIIIFYSGDGTADASDVLTISGLRVRAITSSGSGNLRIATGTTPIVGISGATDFATFSSVASPAVGLTSNDANNIICEGDAVAFTATSTPAATSFKFYKNGVLQTVADGSFSGPGDVFTTTLLQNNDVMTVEATTGAGCSNISAGITTQVKPLPSVFLSSDALAGNKICAGQTLTLTAVGDGDEYRFFKNGTPLNLFSPTTTFSTTFVSNLDDFSVVARYTGAGSNGCSKTSNNIVINVKIPPSVSYIRGSSILSSYASNNTTAVPLTNGSTFGGALNGVVQLTNIGSYSGPGVGGINFYPNVAGVGTHTINYTYTDAVTGCSGVGSIIIDVFDPSSSPINNLSVKYCEGDGIQPAGGTFLTPNLSIFSNPAIFLTSLTGITGYTITCPTNPSVISGSPGSYKINTDNIPLNTSVNVYISVNYSGCSGLFCGFFVSPVPYTYTLFTIVTRNAKPNLSISNFPFSIFPPNLLCATNTNYNLDTKDGATTLNDVSVNYQLSDNGTNFTNANPSVIIPSTGVFNPSALLGTTVGTTLISPTQSTNLWIRAGYTNLVTGCSNTSVPITFKLNPVPNLPISFPTNNCEGSIVTASVVNNIIGEVFNPPNGTFYIKKSGVKLTSPIFAAGQTNIDLTGLVPDNDYTLHYTYITSNGCTGESTPVNFNILPTPATVNIQGLNSSYCANGSTNITLTGKDAATTVSGKFSIRKIAGSGIGAGLINPTAWFDLVNNSTIVTFNPSNPNGANWGLPDRFTTYLYEVRFEYINGSGCKGEKILNYTVSPLPQPTFLSLNGSQACINGGIVNLLPNVTISNGESFDGNNGQFFIRNILPLAPTYSLALNVNTFSPATYGSGTYKIKYVYTTASNCTNESLEQDFIINEIPQNGSGNIVVTNTCFGDDTGFAVDTPEPGLTYAWNFGDGGISSLPNPTRKFVSVGSKNITLTLTKGYGVISCSKVLTITIDIKPYPIARFTSSGFCLAGSTITQFSSASSSVSPPSNITSYLWDFGDGNSSISPNPAHTYSSPGEYSVTLTIGSQLSGGIPLNATCLAAITKKVKIFPVKTPDVLNPYKEDFNSANTGWLTDSVANTNKNSWQQGVPAGTKINSGNSTGAVWKTNLTGLYNDGEQSYVESPCFILNNLDRPVFAFKYWADSEDRYDGVSITYTVDDGVTWKTLGNVGQGLSWYNTSGILSLPGGSIVGWSGNNQTEWKLARFALDQVKAEALGGSVRFRVAFGSNPVPVGSPTSAIGDGFAFDDVYVGNRQRIVLIEHFTNSSDATSRAEDNYLNNFSNSGTVESANIQYHTYFPAADPMNADNTADPSARALFYGISAVPKAIMDGNITQTTNFSTWGQTAYNLRTLEPTPFDIDIAFINAPTDQLNINATVKARTPFSSPVIVHTVVIEKEIYGSIFSGLAGNTFKNVVKRFLPDAAGTRVNTSWNIGTQVVFNQSWKPEKVYDASKLAVVVFIQDDNTKEVHQAAYAEPTVFPSITALDAELSRNVGVYPNPAENQFFIQLNDVKAQNYQYQIHDNTGRLLDKGKLSNQETTKISTSHYAEGMYIVTIIAPNGNTGYKKIIVRR